jgi:hypothetical protein
LTFAWTLLIPIVAIIGGCAVAIVGTLSRQRIRELEIRERIAMIEKGLVPPPEVDPRGFDRVMDRQQLYARRLRDRAPGRHRRVGITLIGVGFGLMVLLSFAGEHPKDGIGVGGFLVVIGVAFLINGLLESRLQTQPLPSAADAWMPPLDSPTTPTNPPPGPFTPGAQ